MYMEKKQKCLIINIKQFFLFVAFMGVLCLISLIYFTENGHDPTYLKKESNFYRQIEITRRSEYRAVNDLIGRSAVVPQKTPKKQQAHSNYLLNDRGTSSMEIRHKIQKGQPKRSKSGLQVFQKQADNSFCHKFLKETYRTPINVCLANISLKSVQCFGNPYSSQMGACILLNVAINPQSLASMIHSVVKNPKNMGAPVSLLHGTDSTCDKINLVSLTNYIEVSSYIFSAVKSLKINTIASVHCQKWIANDAFLFNSNEVHIYFRFLDYFNLHKLLEDYNSGTNQAVHIIRVSEAGYKNYHFPEFDQALFPEAIVYALEKLSLSNICFKRIVTVPRSYGSYPFRCKMSAFLRQKCMQCNKEGSTNQLTTFRKRVLKACSLEYDDLGNFSEIRKILIISRKIYTRYPNDHSSRFQRILRNEHDMVSALRGQFPHATVRLVHMEEYEICQQIKLAHSADLLIGVHGAGLVHLWWLKSNALVYEIEPFSQSGNPTFSMLAKLTGHKYMHQTINGGLHGNHYMVDINVLQRDLSRFVRENTN